MMNRPEGRGSGLCFAFGVCIGGSGFSTFFSFSQALETGDEGAEVCRSFFVIEVATGVFISGADGETDLAFFGINADHFYIHGLSSVEDFAWIFHVVIRDLGDVDEAFDTFFELNKRAEVGEFFDGTGPDGAGSVTLGDTLHPWISAQLFDAEGEALVLLVDVCDDSFDFLSDLKELGGVFDTVCPGDVGDVDESIDAFFDTDEDTEVGDVAYFTDEFAIDRVFVLQQAPGVGLNLFHTEVDATV